MASGVIIPNRLLSITAFIYALLAILTLFVAIQLVDWIPAESAISRICQWVCGIGVLGALTLGACAVVEERRLLTCVALALGLLGGIGLSGLRVAQTVNPSRIFQQWQLEQELNLR